MGMKKPKKYSSYKVVNEDAKTKMPSPPVPQKESNNQGKQSN